MTKPTKWHVRRANTQISLGIHQSDQSSPSVSRKLGFLTSHWAQCKDCDQTGRTSRLVWVFGGRTSFCWFYRVVAQLSISSFSETEKSCLSKQKSWKARRLIRKSRQKRMSVVFIQRYLSVQSDIRYTMALAKTTGTYKWAKTWENLFMSYANNKGADQPAHLHSLISAFVVHCLLDSIMSLLAKSERLGL